MFWKQLENNIISSVPHGLLLCSLVNLGTLDMLSDMWTRN